MKAQTIEATGKSWKAMQLCGGLAIIAGFVGCFSGFGSPKDTADVAIQNGVLMTIGGMALYVFGRVGGWWNHG